MELSTVYTKGGPVYTAGNLVNFYGIIFFDTVAFNTVAN